MSDLVKRLRDFVSSESKNWVNCGTGKLEYVEISKAGKLAQEAADQIERASPLSRPHGDTP